MTIALSATAPNALPIWKTIQIRGTDMDLVVMSIAEFGFQDQATHSEICARALELGLEVCPAEVASILRAAYQDQPDHESICVPSDTDLFVVSSIGGDLDLYSERVYPWKFAGTRDRWVFARPR